MNSLLDKNFQAYPRQHFFPLGRTKKFFLFLLFFLWHCSLCLASHPVIVVGTEANYPPYSFQSEHKILEGFNKDLIDALGKIRESKYVLKYAPFGVIREELAQGKINAVIGMYYSPKRDEIFDFSDPITIVEHKIFHKKDQPPITQISDLKGKKIIVMQDDIMQDYVIENKITSDLIFAKTPKQVIEKLNAGEGQYALLAKLPGMYWIKQLNMGNITVGTLSLLPQKHCLAVREGDKQLLDLMQEDLKILQKNGRIKEIEDKWLGRVKKQIYSPSEKKQVSIGILANRGAKDCRNKWGLMIDYLNHSMPEYNFHLIPLPFDEIFSVVKNEKIEFILLNPSLYAQIEYLYGTTRLATLKNRIEGKIMTKFAGVIFTLANNTRINTYNDLKGKIFMAVDAQSFGGWQMAWWELKENGIDPYRAFKKLLFAGTQDGVVYAVRDGLADAGTVRSDILERMALEGKIHMKNFKILNNGHPKIPGNPLIPLVHSTQTYPEWPIAKLKHTPNEVAEKLSAALIAMPKNGSAAKASRSAGWTIPGNYQKIHELLKELHIGVYKDYGKFTLKDVWKKYWVWILTIGILFMVSVFFVVRFKTLSIVLKNQQNELQTTLEQVDSMNQTLKLREQELNASNQQLLANQKELQTNEKQLKANEEKLKINEQLLNEKVMELQKKNKSMTGRELRIIELKERIKKLEKGLSDSQGDDV